MIGSLVENIFKKVYTFMKLNFMFLMVVFMGGVFLGMGPAFLTISDLYVAHKFDSESMQFKDLPFLFKKNFRMGNRLFYIFFILIFIVVYNFYLSIQIRVPWIVFVQILMGFTILLLAVTYLYAVVLNSYYEIKIYDLLKLSFVSFFANILQLFRFIISLIAIYFIFRLMPGLLLFGIFSLLIVVAVESLASWIEVLDETIVYENV